MRLAQSRLTGQGQVSVPAEVRRRLGLVPGSMMEWNAEGDRIFIRRAGRYTSEELHQVLFPRLPKARSLKELREGIRRHVRAGRARG